MVLEAWEALADRSLRSVLVAGALLWENRAKARAAPDPCPPTGLGAIPPPEVRPTKINYMYKKCWFKKYFFIWNNDYQGPINFFLYFSFSYHWNTHHLVKLCYFKKKILVEKKKFTPLDPVLVIITLFILKLNHLFKSISTPKRRVFFL